MSENTVSSGEVTLLLTNAQEGDGESAERLFQILAADLRSSANNMMKLERADHTLQPTALINEACVRLLDQQVIRNAANRRYLFAAANQAMRQILVDHSRKRNAAKRGGDWTRGSLDIVLDNFESQSGFPFEELDAALSALEEDAPRQREVVEHRFFGGLTVAETAALLEVSEGTVERDWRLARVKLYAAMKSEE